MDSAEAPKAAPKGRRIAAIDLTRGVLMCLIIATHAKISLAVDFDPLVDLMGYALSGTVGFTTISGVMIGYFVAVRRDAFARLQKRYAVQSVRLLLIAHPLIALALLPVSGPFHEAGLADMMWRFMFITDVLAVLFLVVVPFMPKVPARTRLLVGLGLIIVGRLGTIIPVEGASVLEVGIKDVLFGVDQHGRHVLYGAYPAVGLFGMFLVGSFLGERFGAAERDGKLAQLRQQLLIGALALTVVANVLVGAWAAAKFSEAPSWLTLLLYPDMGLTLYPAYLAETMVVLAIALRIQEPGPIARGFILFGRTSLFVYVAQYYVVQTVPVLLGWRSSLSPLGFAAMLIASFLALHGMAMLWRRHVQKATD